MGRSARPASTVPAVAPAARTALILTATLAVLALLGLVLGHFDPTATWAFTSWLVYPVWLRLMLAASIVVLAFPTISGRAAGVVTARMDRLTPTALTIVVVVVVAALLVVFWRLPSQNHILGDGSTILARISAGDIASVTEPLTYLANHLLYRVFEHTAAAGVNAFRAAGILSALLLFTIFFYHSNDRREFFFSLAVFLTLGVVQFFAGYVENYTYAFVAGVACTLSACRDQERRRLGPFTAIALVLAMAFHVSMAVLLPSILFLWHQTLAVRFRTVLVAAVGVVLFAGGTIFLARAGLLEQTFVPLYPTALNPYHLFSLQHLTDLANVVVRNHALLPVLLITPVFRRLPERNLLLSAIIPAVLFTILIDPKIGAVRDWDLLSVAAAPGLAALIVTLRRLFAANHRAGYQLLLPFFLFGVLHTGSWLLLNSDRQRGYEFVKGVIQHDVHYTSAYYDGYRLIPWHVLAYNVYDDVPEAVRVLEMHLSTHPTDIYNAYQLAVIKSLAGETQAAARLVRDRWYPALLEQPRMAWELSRVFRRADCPGEQEAVLRAYLNLKGDHDWITYELGSLLRDRGQLDSAWALQSSVLARKNMLTLEHQVDFVLFAVERSRPTVAMALLRELGPRLPDPYRTTAARLADALARNDSFRIGELQAQLRLLLDK